MSKSSKTSFYSRVLAFLVADKIRTVLLLLCAIVAGYICFYRLGAAKFDDWDEAWYAEMTRTMLATKQFIVLQWNHQFLFDKPPLSIWSSALFSSLFGLSEFSIRLTSALAGFFTIILVVWYSYKKWGIVPSLLTFSTLLLNNIYIWRVRSGNLDALATFLIFLVFLVADSKWRKRYIALGVLFGFIFLAKASLVVLPLCIFGMYELIYNTKNIVKTLPEYGKLLLVAIFVIAPWLLLGGKIAGAEFVTYYLFNSDQGVANARLSYVNTDYIWHTYYSLQRRFFFVFVFGIVALSINIKKGTHFLLIVFSLFLLLLLSFTEKNNNWYLVPSIPFWALTVGFGTYTFVKLFRKKTFKIPAIIVVLLLAGYVSQKTFRENITPIIHKSETNKQYESAVFVNRLTKTDEVVARLDHLYPTAIYYSNRKVLSSPADIAGRDRWFIGRQELATLVKNKEIRVVFGKQNDMKDFVSQYALEGTLHFINDEELVFETKITDTDSE